MSRKSAAVCVKFVAICFEQGWLANSRKRWLGAKLSAMIEGGNRSFKLRIISKLLRHSSIVTLLLIKEKPLTIQKDTTVSR